MCAEAIGVMPSQCATIITERSQILMPATYHRRIVSQTIRTEKARRGITFDQLSVELAKHGVIQSPSNLRTKASKGVMNAGLFLAILDVLGVDELRIPDLVKDIKASQK